MRSICTWKSEEYPGIAKKALVRPRVSELVPQRQQQKSHGFAGMLVVSSCTALVLFFDQGDIFVRKQINTYLGLEFYFIVHYRRVW